ncbi:thiolase family protein [Luteolibacter flavescens]|uniref:Thiolase family protein n=1 Tax=Luteolibacter flavescens TaxID=1859460 RepID=A0ABT3FIN3_9BACT|nr:thiolase family protein [Luteolibacter flavescens]MCW1883426.1 thiolase family protein [Luteolibacter flavescens]
MNDLFIIAGIRTPFIRSGTDFDALTADDLGRHACTSLLLRTGIDPALIDEVIFGCVAQPAEAANLARVIALRSGIPEKTPAMTVHRNCASGMEAITTAHQRLATGQGELFLVGGAESMSRIPFFYPHGTVAKFAALSKAKETGEKITAIADFRPKDFKPRIGLQLGLTDPVSGEIMGDTAETLAREFHLTRDLQDAFAASSHRKALGASDHLLDEIAPVHLPGKAVTRDNGVRTDSTPEKLAKLRPIFDRQSGSVTAGNSSQVTDGAVALLVGSEQAAKKLGIEPLGRLTSYAYTGCDPRRMGLGPVHAIAKLGRSPESADVIEINEAFAAQVLAVLAALKQPDKCGAGMSPVEISPERINRRGGAIALGHPVGASGARLILTALHQLRETGGRQALATLCVGGGQGAALWLERP